MIMGMDWLTENYVGTYCYRKELVVYPPLRTNFKFKGTNAEDTSKVVYELKAKKLIQQ